MSFEGFLAKFLSSLQKECTAEAAICQIGFHSVHCATTKEDIGGGGGVSKGVVCSITNR